jgi:enoyl-CoA hydratase
MAHGKVNALDVEFLAELSRTIRELESASTRAVVLASSRHVFSAGVDLFRVLDGGPGYAQELIAGLHEGFLSWFASPLPIVAAVAGSAIAGGCILAAAADVRLMAEGPSVIGVSELAVGVPFPAAALEIIDYACGRDAAGVVLGARLYSPGDAITVGLVHEVVPAPELLPRALAVATSLAELPGEATALAKAHLRSAALARIEERSGHDADVARIWGDPSTHQMIRKALDRTIGARRR